MSKTQTRNPIASLFELQRRSLEQGQRTLEQSMSMQRQMTDTFLDTMDSQKTTQKKGVEVVKSATDAYLSMFEATMPGDTEAFEDVHTAVDDQFEAFDEVHTQLWDTFEHNVRENADAYENVSDQYVMMMNDSLDFVLEANRQMEDQSVAVAESVEREIE